MKQKVCTSWNLSLALPLLNIQLEHCHKLEMCFVDYDKYSIVLQRDSWTSFYCGIFGNQVCCESQRNSPCKKGRDEKERRNKESWEKKRKKKYVLLKGFFFFHCHSKSLIKLWMIHGDLCFWERSSYCCLTCFAMLVLQIGL